MRWSSRQYLIAFNMVQGIGGRRLLALKGYFGSLDKAWHAPRDGLLKVPGLGSKIVDGFCQVRESLSPLAEEQWAVGLGASIITLVDPSYPEYLRRLLVPPPVLYVLGKLPQDLGVAVVGTRKPSRQGIAQAREFAAYLARQGEVVISGLARGIDYFAHDQVLQMDGRTLAVLGSNLGNLYPREHKHLVERIRERGAVVSEFSSKCPTVPGNFPRRNRLIAGFSKGVLVVQAGAKSGAIGTADWALELGLDVWAIPGEISDPLRDGTHNLIKQGAYLVTHPENLLGASEQALAPSEQDVAKLHRLGHHANEIADLLDLPINQILAEISILQVAKSHKG